MADKNYNKIVGACPAGYGQKIITILYFGKQYSAHYTCMPIWDKFNSKELGWKQAGNEIYNYIKRANNLR